MNFPEPCCKPKVVEGKAPVPDTSDGFYRRPLPSSTCVGFESARGRQLFKEAMADGTSKTPLGLENSHSKVLPRANINFCRPGMMETYFRYVFEFKHC